MTPSAEIAASELLKKSGYGASQLVDANLTPEQARDVIFFATGVRIPAGLIEAEMRRARAVRPSTETAEDAASDFRRARSTEKQSASTTDLYKLIAQKV